MVGDYIGIPFQDGGRTREGADCWGVLNIFYAEELGIALPSFSDQYTTTEDRVALSNVINGNMDDWIEVDEPQFADAVLIALGGAKTHIGIYIGNNLVLHTDRKSGSFIEPIHSPKLNRRIDSFYRHRNFINDATENNQPTPRNSLHGI
ncbi:C40 family peptidase [Aureimonas altamirensis]|uniref:C40 family peptidase n=1 Tax=Aureimonas altamirensis TaxID=370622 RepID=UPI00301AE852